MVNRFIPNSQMAWATGASLAASVGDFLLLYVANARRPEFQWPLPSPLWLWLGGLLGVLAIPLYALGYGALAKVVPQPSGRIIWLCGWITGIVGSVIHGLTTFYIYGSLQLQYIPGDPIEEVLRTGWLLPSLWLVATLAVLALTGFLTIAFWRKLLPPRLFWFNPVLMTLALSLLGLASPQLAAFLTPAAPNLAHLVFFAACLWILRNKCL